MWLQKGNRRNPCNDGSVLYLHCINVNILAVMMLHYNLQHHQMMGSGGNRISPSYNCMRIQNDLKIKSLMRKNCLLVSTWREDERGRGPEARSKKENRGGMSDTEEAGHRRLVTEPMRGTGRVRNEQQDGGGRLYAKHHAGCFTSNLSIFTTL